MSFKRTDGLVRLWVCFATLIALATFPTTAGAQTPGYPEKVVQWTVKSGESCEDISKALYGSAGHKALIQRYNSVACTPGAPLKNGMTLVLPAKVTVLPAAKITSVKQETRARPGGGGWSSAYSGQPLGKSSSVNTRTKGRAGIQFRDRTRVYLAEHTLVVIYGTAAQTHVSKSPPPAVKLEKGELQAGLAALRGRPVAIEVGGGGRVDATSKDAVVHKRGKRTNVSVFHGSAAVKSAGKSVKVPTNYGTRFWEKKAPEKPRPLPAAPRWLPGGSGALSLAFDGNGIITASWSKVKKAKQYRVELALDAAFTELVVRQHVPANVTSFRAEKLPLGRYFMRVRVIDTDDFLGIASTVRNTELVGASWKRGTGRMTPDGLEVGRYAVLALTPSADLQLAFDGGPFGALPSSVDFRRIAPKALRVRRGGGVTDQVKVRYVDPAASLHLSRAGDTVTVRVSFTNVAGIDVQKTLAPEAHLRFGDASVAVPLTKVDETTFTGTATVPAGTSFLALVQDDFGRMVARRLSEPQAGPMPSPDRPLPQGPPVWTRIGASMPVLGISPRTNVLWTSPTATNQGLIGVRIDSTASPVSVQGFAHASGAIGPIGLDATVSTPASEDASADSSALFGLRFRAYRNEDGSFEFGPWMRVGFPLDDLGPSPRLEPGVAFGGAVDEFTWLANLGARLRLDGENDERAFVDPVQGFGLVGGSYDPLGWLRLYSLVDLSILAPGANESVKARGGLSFGVEAGERWYVGLGARATPWNDAGGHIAGQLNFGFRED